MYYNAEAKMNLNSRYIALVTVEAETPLLVGSGVKENLLGNSIAKDANSLPYIPGTGLTGVLWHSFNEYNTKELTNTIFGFGGIDGMGSLVKISSANLLSETGVIEGLQQIDFTDDFFRLFTILPQREHVRINHKGASDNENHGKFTDQVVYRGTRFVFKIELLADAEAGLETWNKLLEIISSPEFRIGGGTRKGFGKLKIINESSFTRHFDLRKEDNLEAYLNLPNSLNIPDNSNWTQLPEGKTTEDSNWKKYTLELKPKDFFIFSSGFADDEAKSTPKLERYIEWVDKKPQLRSESSLLIPASSIKGALAHRVAFEYNLLNKFWIEDNLSQSNYADFDLEQALSAYSIDENLLNDIESIDSLLEKVQNWNAGNSELLEDYVNSLDEVNNIERLSSIPNTGDSNIAVKALFGFAKNDEIDQNGQKGNVIIDDFFLPFTKSKIFNHNKIDRFTNGTIDGALFSEKVVYDTKNIKLKIFVNIKAFESDKNIEKAFNLALDAIKNGSLALGGMTTKGHGVFEEAKKIME
jgi:CRISPR/Cas system CSM-associated protein Csm3 (group 7 of RAMP superfamily)